MRYTEGLQTEPDYPTVGFSVFYGRGNHVLLEGPTTPDALFSAALTRGDGAFLELGPLSPNEDKIVIIPYTDTPQVRSRDKEQRRAMYLPTPHHHASSPHLATTPHHHTSLPRLITTPHHHASPPRLTTAEVHFYW